MSKLPSCNRHIATHDSSGKSIYAPFEPQQFSTSGKGTGFARSYSVTLPANLKDDADMKAYLAGPESVTSRERPEIVVPPESGNGANLLVIDLAPGGFSVMHRTVSVDYSICVIGSIIHELDSGEKVTLKPGDHIVQRGTNHRWINASDTEPARFVAATVPCVPFEIAGKTLTEVHPPDDKGYKPKL